MSISFTQFSFAQNKNCNCPENNLGATGKANKVYSFKNGKTIGLCGTVEAGKKDVAYSEFILFQCGKNKILQEWDATETCNILMKNDTLTVQELYGLAINKQQQIKWVPFYITRYYFDSAAIKHTSFFKRDLPKYTTTVIRRILNSYNKLTKQTAGDSILLTAHRLFWAYVSGSQRAGRYLDSFEKKFGPFDGAVAEEYHDLWSTYQLYKK
ncbi:hypothetical protein [Ferruginibacter sp.]